MKILELQGNFAYITAVLDENVLDLYICGIHHNLVYSLFLKKNHKITHMYSKTCLNWTPMGLKNLLSLYRYLVYTGSNYIDI
jgi:hypothetical protein